VIHEAEQSTLGGLLLDNSRIHDVDTVAEDFHHPAHQRIYRAIQALVSAGGVADVVTVTEWLERNQGVEHTDLAYVAELALNTPSAANVHVYAELVRNDSRRRRALGILHDGIETIKEDGSAGIDHIIADLMHLVEGARHYECSVQDTIGAAADRLDWLEKHPGLVGLSTGLVDLDEFLGGFQPADLYVIGARPAIGKTALMLNMALNAGKAVGVFSAEQPKVQVGQRIIAISGGASTTNMRRAAMTQEDWSAVTKTFDHLKDSVIRVNDKSSPTLIDIVRQTRRWKREHGIRGIYLDYIQRMRGPNQLKRHEQIEEIARGLKELAKELDISVVALAQVNREVEKRADKRPHMSDLRDSGAIEQEADNVMMLYRDEVYHEHTKFRGVIEINVEKNRHGRTGYISATWEPERMRVSNLAPEYQEGKHDREDTGIRPGGPRHGEDDEDGR